VIAVILVGVRAGEPADRVGERTSLADVAVDGDRVAGASVRASQSRAAGGGELRQARGDQAGRRDDLHVAELTDVVVLPVQ
jgi:hypothetical protein